MRSAFEFSRTRSIESALESWDRRIFTVVDPWHFGDVEADLLRPAEAERRAGSKPLFAMVDPEGRKYILKVAEPALMAAEQAAYRLRKLGGRPTVPARIVDLTLENSATTRGLLKPFVEFDHARELSTDTSAWTELQRHVILREHAWDWFLDNLDSNTGQFALIGDEGYPLNIDWDRAFADAGTSELTRFAKYRVTLPNARTFLYAGYVEGRIKLDLKVLTHEAKRIRHLKERDVRPILTDYARIRFDDPDEARAFVRRTLMRKRSIESEVAHFVRQLREERRQLTGRGSSDIWPRPRVAALLVWNSWQVVLHELQRGAVGTFTRHLLTRVRARSAGVPSDLQVASVDSPPESGDGTDAEQERAPEQFAETPLASDHAAQ